MKNTTSTDTPLPTTGDPEQTVGIGTLILNDSNFQKATQATAPAC